MAHASVLDRINNELPEIDVYREGDPYRPIGISRKAFGGEPLIDFISKDGNHRAFAYSHLYDITFDPSTGIELHFSDHTVTLSGRRLAECYGQLLRQRVVFICEADHAASNLADASEPVITRIAIADRD